MRRILAVGSIGVVVLLILVLFSSIICAQTPKSKDNHPSLIQLLKEKQKASLSSDWFPGGFIEIIASILFYLIYVFFAYILADLGK